MAINVYQSDDVSAPILNATNGSLIAVLKACLVDGYGSKAGAGWSVALEDAPNNKIILRNNSVSGTGRYFRLQDDGFLYSGHAGGKPSMAVMRGCESFTDIDATAGNFPNIAGDANADSATYYGVAIIKKSSNTSVNPSPWAVWADDKTCYLMISYSEDNKTDPHDQTVSDTLQRNFLGFGDFKTMAGAIDANAAFIIGNGFNSSVASSFNYFGSCDDDGNINGHYLNRGMEGNAGAIEFSKRPVIDFTKQVPTYLGGVNGTIAQQHTDYPSLQSGGAILTDVLIQENTNAVERTLKHTDYQHGARGFLPGIKSTPHNSYNANTKKLGTWGDTFTINGRNYRLLAVSALGTVVNICVDLTGPWS